MWLDGIEFIFRTSITLIVGQVLQEFGRLMTKILLDNTILSTPLIIINIISAERRPLLDILLVIP